ncbi:hypothetical protein CRE_27581 [Caenorhabditis remanei]|uniref:Uncharacterized protein n=1 Tax=Caenorhabditis remanei TaxID=31234 RepID=E3MKR4_CAERE|nr:hypothetical protein CRE_27581 [Caenorhabditis remanei]
MIEFMRRYTARMQETPSHLIGSIPGRNPFLCTSDDKGIIEKVSSMVVEKTCLKSREKLLNVVDILKKNVEPSRLTTLRNMAYMPSNILKVALYLPKPERKTYTGRLWILHRLYQIVRMDSQYITQRETVDYLVQLLEIHGWFNPKKLRQRPEKEIPQRVSRRCRR